MTDMSLSGLISSNVLSDLNPYDTITRIKAAAIRQFEALDARMRIHSTEYFNHSFAPDLVLTWSQRRQTERYVYMRSSSREDALTDDVLRLGEQQPIVLGLVPVHHAEAEEGGIRLNNLAREHNTLVTDSTALTSIADAKRERPITGLFSTALTQGGRGLVDDDDARKTTDAIVEGFAGAQAIGTDSVRRAARAAEDHLSTPFANRFNRLLQAVWIGSGGRPDLFPYNRLDLSAGVDDDALEFLLELEPVRDYDFWRRIGRTTSVAQIGGLSPHQPNENLQFLVKANLDHLTARSCRVRDRQAQLDELDQPHFWWRTERGALALRSSTWIAFVAEKADDLGDIEGTPTEGVSIADLIERIGNTVLTSLQMSDGTFELDLSSPEHADVVHSDHLGAVSQSFGKTAKVLRARAMAGGRQITCDFSKSSASATTSSVLSVSELLDVSLPLLRHMEDAARSELNDTLRPLEDPNALLATTDYHQMQLDIPNGSSDGDNEIEAGSVGNESP
jgi:hypothetical protein